MSKEETREYLDKMTKEIAIDIAGKYANDIWLFGSVDKECVSQVCKLLLEEIDIANKKLEEMKKSQLETLSETRKYLNSKKVTPEMVAIAMRKIEISILGE